MDTAKRDMTLTYEGRTFAIRAYREGSGSTGLGWQAIVLEHRTPLPHELGASPTPADCLAEAVRFVTAFVEAHRVAPVAVTTRRLTGERGSGGVDGWRPEGGAVARDRAGPRAPRPAP